MSYRSRAVAFVATALVVLAATLCVVVPAAPAAAAPQLPSLPRPAVPLVGAAATPSGAGMWAVAGDGGVFSLGDARFFGSTGAMRLNRPVVGMAATPSGGGYWLVASDGGIFSFGDARFFGSTGAMRLNHPIVGMAAHPSGEGYWLVASDGGIFSFGTAPFHGSTGAIRLNQPIIGMTSHRSGSGYWFVARDGGVFSFGASTFQGSGVGAGAASTAAIVASSIGGYWLVRSDGGVSTFGATSGAPSIGDGGGHPRVEKQGGVTHAAWWHNNYATRDSDRMIGEIAATGAGWLVLVPTWFQATMTSTAIAPDPLESETDASVRQAIRVAKSRGLKVFLKPHVDLKGFSGWRGDIRPSNLDEWFASYINFITTWARVAQQEGVEQFAVGTELASLSGQTARWHGVVDAVRSNFGGGLTYAANFDEYERVQFWDRLDYIGVDAYFELVKTPTTDVATLRNAWAPIAANLRTFSTRWSRPILFTEAGYVSQVGSTTQPWNWELSFIRSDAEQAAGYQAMFEVFWNEPWFAGIHWWMWDFIGRPIEDAAMSYSPHGKPAEAVLREWFAR
ncbi:MAG TPA: hypothetical protein VM345_08835 [Acidimicrobiales bacterium]|nr:hypothetical protein [Acidimicrobiales bacterium]